MDKYTILIGDDHVLIVEGLKNHLLNNPKVEAVETALNSTDVLDLLEKTNFQILFLDIHFGNSDGRILAKEILLKHPSIIIAALTSLDDKESIKSTVLSGFKAYFLKSDSLDEINRWIENEDFKTIYLSKQTQMIYNANDFLMDANYKKSLLLSEREKEIVYLLTEEFTSKKIAEKMNLSEKTIENYRSNLLLKFEVTNVVGLVKKAILLGFLR